MNKKNKFILDACCGGRFFWLDKEHPNALFIDIKSELPGFIKERPNFSIQPDVVMDFRKMAFADKSFKLIVWDPPHLLDLNKRGWPAKKYGTLNAQTWPFDLKKGFSECWRVLDDYGVLIFKWSFPEKSRGISFEKILKLFPVQPLFGQPTNKKATTMWFCFMKIPIKTEDK